MSYAVVFLGGLAGSFHCIGMCGGFPLALAGARPERPWLRQILYNLGRLNTLVFVGALSGAAGSVLVSAGPGRLFERGLALVTGTLMILVGLEMAGAISFLSARLGRLVQGTVGRLLGGVIRSRSLAAPLALGTFNAFLPCHLIYAFAARAASTASVREGILTMLAFGLGTVPSMMAVGLARAVSRPGVRARLSLASAALVIVFGLVTLLRGAGGMTHAVHVH